MRIAFLAMAGLVMGVVGGATLGIGLGLAWIELFNTSEFEGYAGMLVFFTFMPLGALIGGLGGATLFGMAAFRDHEVAVARQRVPREGVSRM
ncbi:hypothetical protein LQG66_31040 [Bradyrhizobium ontarionense]|uniref:Uncharacterized protein n=1 Tax=Bradyrhizobium ontarionense TaxID=2898149 RepID=A0ABY3RA19_9BRAD|nr:hypothetical protein [Bradyrhizobium sp. A19]UFZ03607.1 hypothetical protein LQG66_31040 [Bradyrhizobium sp. A19]